MLLFIPVVHRAAWRGWFGSVKERAGEVERCFSWLQALYF